MHALRRLGVPYTDDEIAKAPAELEGKTEEDALVAYLQGPASTSAMCGSTPRLPAGSRPRSEAMAMLSAFSTVLSMLFFLGICWWAGPPAAGAPTKSRPCCRSHCLTRRRWRARAAMWIPHLAGRSVHERLHLGFLELLHRGDRPSRASWCVWLLFSQRKVAKAQGAVEDTGHVWDGDLRELNNPLPRWWMWMFLLACIFGLGYRCCIRGSVPTPAC